MKLHSLNNFVQTPKYAADISDKDGSNIVSVRNENNGEYEPLEYGIISEEQAKERARQLNEEYRQDIKELEHQNNKL